MLCEGSPRVSGSVEVVLRSSCGAGMDVCWDEVGVSSDEEDDAKTCIEFLCRHVYNFLRVIPNAGDRGKAAEFRWRIVPRGRMHGDRSIESEVRI